MPDAAAVFTGDILFAASTPVMWAGPVSSWIAAADLILSLEPGIIVPGHGPLATPQMVRDLQEYLRFVQRESRQRFAAGMDAVAAADDIDLGPYANWGDAERIAVERRDGLPRAGSRTPCLPRAGAVRAHGALEGSPSPTRGLMTSRAPPPCTEPET